MTKDNYDYLVEFNEYGYILYECPTCGNECEPTEVDSSSAYCSECEKKIKIEPII